MRATSLETHCCFVGTSIIKCLTFALGDYIDPIGSIYINKEFFATYAAAASRKTAGNHFTLLYRSLPCHNPFLVSHTDLERN
jgi:hypothetical protein